MDHTLYFILVCTQVKNSTFLWRKGFPLLTLTFNFKFFFHPFQYFNFHAKCLKHWFFLVIVFCRIISKIINFFKKITIMGWRQLFLPQQECCNYQNYNYLCITSHYMVYFSNYWGLYFFWCWQLVFWRNHMCLGC